jgi:hypothetical protein
MKRLFACTLLVALAGLLGVPAATADNAPMWESSVGLTPGAATTIRMQSEDVSLQIVERGSAAVAVVDATFDMNNPGPMTRLYVLRTGALWADTIGKATVTFTAPDGGGFVGAEKTAEASDSKLVWQFSDFKPMFDPDAAYIYRAPWQELKAAEARVGAPDAAPADFLRAAALGSAAAAEKRASLDTTVTWMKDVAFMDPVQSCS